MVLNTRCTSSPGLRRINEGAFLPSVEEEEPRDEIRPTTKRGGEAEPRSSQIRRRRRGETGGGGRTAV